MKWLALLVLVALVSYYGQSRGKKAEEQGSIQGVEEESAPLQTVVSAITPHPSITSGVSTEGSTRALPANPINRIVSPKRYREKPKDMYVEFEVVDGYAVAYGDTILGKPTSDFHDTVGMAEVRPPQYWDQGEVPFLIKDDVVNPERIHAALEIFNQKTNVKFIPFQNQVDAIIFVRGEKNCQSFLGRTGGAQSIFLSENCGVPEISHELMHALGFIHEQSRIDRDQYIDIQWDHIEEKFQSQFAMVPEPLMDSLFDSPFDPTSVMMYDPHMFAIKPGLLTMTLKGGAPLNPPPRRLSAVDVARINRLYPK